MINKFALFAVSLLILSVMSCDGDKKNNKYLFETNFTETPLTLVANNYSNYSNKIKEDNRITLRTELPNRIDDIFNIYKNAIIDLERKKIYATSNSDYNKYVKEIQLEVIDSLLIKEVQVNLKYFELLEDLEYLNVQYSKEYNIPIDSFKSYYDLQHIVLGDEVLKKIAELEKEEIVRQANLKKQRNIDAGIFVGTTAISLLIPTGPNTKISAMANSLIAQVSNGFKNAIQGKALQEKASVLTQKTWQMANKAQGYELGSGANKLIYKQLSNPEKRAKVKVDILSIAKTQSTSFALSSAATNYNKITSRNEKIQHSKEYFQVIDTELRGKIGNFSDGIMTVHFENINSIIKHNQQLIDSHTTSKSAAKTHL